MLENTEDGDGTWVLFRLTMKMSLLLLTAFSVHLSLSPPNPPVKSDECCSGTKGTDTIFEKVVQSVTFCSKCMVWAGTICELLAIFVHGVSSAPLSSFHDGLAFSNKPSLALPVSIHPIVIVGAISTAVAAILRNWCFKSLGPLFTFEITIRPKHELITSGPYAWVRHPSYTGVYLTLLGATLVLGGPGSWMAEIGWRSTLGFAMAMVWIVKCTFAFRGMCVRLRAEDEVLRDTFGAEWDEYATRVPFKFVPGIV
ncbi:hypothetical protein B0H34DRAFT_537791 [Crassisporium funariophilum]|nr:hypothetical protein B0H34DRAFT_537791 [Crassisporium funariophilum]